MVSSPWLYYTTNRRRGWALQSWAHHPSFPMRASRRYLLRRDASFFYKYILVINATGDTLPVGHCSTVLLHCLGVEGQNFFLHSAESKYTVALLKHFFPKADITCRHTFRQRTQQHDGTVPQHVAALRTLATPCGFGLMGVEMIQDQLISYA